MLVEARARIAAANLWLKVVGIGLNLAQGRFEAIVAPREVRVDTIAHCVSDLRELYARGGVHWIDVLELEDGTFVLVAEAVAIHGDTEHRL